MNVSTYNKHKVYEVSVLPLIEKIHTLCKDYSIPFFFTAAVENTESATTSENISLSPHSAEIHLMDDRIENCIKISSGCEVIIPMILPDIEL